MEREECMPISSPFPLLTVVFYGGLVLSIVFFPFFFFGCKTKLPFLKHHSLSLLDLNL